MTMFALISVCIIAVLTAVSVICVGLYIRDIMDEDYYD